MYKKGKTQHRSIFTTCLKIFGPHSIYTVAVLKLGAVMKAKMKSGCRAGYADKVLPWQAGE